MVVRLYQLRTAGAFNAASFTDIYERDDEVLADDLLARETFPVVPRESRRFVREMDEDARYLGIVAEFREWENAAWRGLVATPYNETIAVRVRLTRNRLAVREE